MKVDEKTNSVNKKCCNCYEERASPTKLATQAVETIMILPCTSYRIFLFLPGQTEISVAEDIYSKTFKVCL